MGCHEALFTLGERPEDALPRRRGRGSPTTGTPRPSTTSSAACRAGARRDRAAPPRQRRRAAPRRARTAARGQPVAGDDDRVARGRLGEPGGPHHGAPDKTPERRLATLEAAGARAHPVHHRDPRRHRRDPRRNGSTRCGRSASTTSATVTCRRSSSRTSCPSRAPRCTRADPCRPTSSCGPIAAARLVLPRGDAPPGPAEPERRPRRAARRRHRRLGRRLAGHADHVNPERPWPDARAAARPRPRRPARCSPRASPSTPSTSSTPSAGSHPEVRFAVLVRVRQRGTRARRRRGRRGGDLDAAAAVARAGAVARARRRTAVGEVLDGVLAGEEPGVDELVTLLEARGPDVAPVAAAGRRAAARDRRRRRHLRPQPQHQLHERLHVQVPVLRVLEGPALAEPAGHAVPARRSRRSSAACVEAVDCGATEVCLQGGIHPDFDGDYYLDVARAVKEVAPRIHVHGFTALEVTEGARRLGMPLARLPRLAKDAGLLDAAGHRGRDPRRRGPGDHLPRQDQHRGVARGPPDRAPGRAALEHHDHVRPRRAPGPRGPPPRPHPRAAEGDRRVHRVRAAPVRAHGDADLPAEAGASRARPSARCSSCTRSGGSRTGAHRQHPGVVGEDGRARRAAAPPRRAATTSAAR